MGASSWRSLSSELAPSVSRRPSAVGIRMKLPLRVLVLCTANSARSQIAEALLRERSTGRVEVESAGVTPAAQVNPSALRVLAAHGVPVVGHRPKGTEEALGSDWDVVITVCDQAREACPVLPEATLTAHWGVEDPVGSPNETQAFEEAFRILSRRINEFLSLPLARLASKQLRTELDRIGRGN